MPEIKDTIEIPIEMAKDLLALWEDNHNNTYNLRVPAMMRDSEKEAKSQAVINYLTDKLHD